MNALENSRLCSVHKVLVTFIISVLFITNVFLLLKPSSPVHKVDSLVYYYAYPQKDVSCHVNKDSMWMDYQNRSLSPDLKPSDSRIFFLEISCKGGLTSRQACAVESAARSNPDWSIQVLILGPMHEMFQRTNLYKALRTFQNVDFATINLSDFVQGTSVEFVFKENISLNLKNAEAVIKIKYNLASLLKYLTLYKYGGVFMEMDFIVTNSFNDLAKNWAGKQLNNELGDDVLSFSNDVLGRTIANITMLEISKYANPVIEDSGKSILARALRRICTTNDVANMSADTCQGFEFYGIDHFYPVARDEAEDSFRSVWTEPDLADTHTVHAHRFWSEITTNIKLPIDSRLDTLARLHCPTVYGIYGETFGV